MKTPSVNWWTHFGKDEDALRELVDDVLLLLGEGRPGGGGVVARGVRQVGRAVREAVLVKPAVLAHLGAVGEAPLPVEVHSVDRIFFFFSLCRGNLIIIFTLVKKDGCTINVAI